jgi:hypothetical protein
MMFASHRRAYDTNRHAVRFHGYDSAAPCSFFITAEALRRVQPAMIHSEAGMLEAFDSNRELICAMAARLYSSAPFNSYASGVAEI